MQRLNDFMAAINAVLWHEIVLFALLGTGVLFTLWTRFSQFRALSHGTQLLRGRYRAGDDAPGAISHFQAMTAALSGTVGLGNIGGVALAISLGGPGAVFWMWVVGLVGMGTKLTEVTLSMLYRNVDDPQNPSGGPMWVASRGFAAKGGLAGVGKALAVVFCTTLLIAATTGGNMFQAWSVGDLTENYFGVPSVVSGIVLALVVGSVIIGGISRIGAVTARLVPTMVALYLLAGTFVLLNNLSAIPQMLTLIVTSAFSPADAQGAFIGGSVASAFLFGMKRAQFSNEAGQGTSSMAHAAARCDEPVREGVVAGLEPFVDTVVVCTFTALIILSTGVWARPAAATFDTAPAIIPISASTWRMETVPAPPRDDGQAWSAADDVFLIYEADKNPNSGNTLHRLPGRIEQDADGGASIVWNDFTSGVVPSIQELGLYLDYTGATLTAQAFDSVAPGLGRWLVTVAAWLFAVSTMVSWSYYGEQGIVYLAGPRAVLPYKLAYCALAVVATLGFIRTSTELDNLTGIGVGVMLLANLPIMWIFGHQAVSAYRAYVRKLDAGEFDQPQ